MLQKNFQAEAQNSEFQIEIWDYPHTPSFMFQQYRSFDEHRIFPYEALAILKHADGSPLSNGFFFDKLRTMEDAWHIAVDKFLVPIAIKTAVEKKRLPVAVNVHLATLLDKTFMASLEKAMNAYGLSKKDVLLEIVEPHVPTMEQAMEIAALSSRTHENGFTLIVDDHDFETGHLRLERLAPYCEMVKIDMVQAQGGVATLQAAYPHLTIVIERVTFNDREQVFKTYPDVLVQGI